MKTKQRANANCVKRKMSQSKKQSLISSFFTSNRSNVVPAKLKADKDAKLKEWVRKPLKDLTTPEKINAIRSDSILSAASQNDGFEDITSSDTSFQSPELNNFRNPILSRSFSSNTEANLKKRGHNNLLDALQNEAPRKITKLSKPKAVIANTSGVDLSKEQLAVVSYVVERRKNTFYTGSAGTGKSVVLRELVRRLNSKYGHEYVGVTASTGLASHNIGGQTLHKFLGIGMGTGDVAALEGALKNKPSVLQRWRRIKVLIIDEISMIDGTLFTKLDKLGQVLRKNSSPFGGIQIVCTGDFFQLPPVSKNGQGQYCFESTSWNQTIQKTILLTQVFRQKGDNDLIDMLNSLRSGEIQQHMLPKFYDLQKPKHYSDGIEPTELYPTRREVKFANEKRLNSINFPSRTFNAEDSSTNQFDQNLLENLMCEKTLTLKPGAQVMYLMNRDLTIVNGSIGKILFMCTQKLFLHIDEIYESAYCYDESLLQEVALITSRIGVFSKQWTTMEQTIFDQIPSERKSKFNTLIQLAAGEPQSQIFPVVNFKDRNGMDSTIIVTPEPFTIQTGVGKREITRTQLPLILSWAMSIHKAQGQTIKRLRVDLQKSFEKGQIYVALSRAVDKENLEIRNFNPRSIQVSDKVKVFYKQLETVS